MLINSPGGFDFLEIGLASPDRIRFWSHGEVEKPETINYRTFKPERKGLFCEKIFGPVKDWECSCGKYRRVRYRGIVCERCGVEVTHSKVRRERMGHIELAAEVSHIWFLKGIPSYMGLMLDMSSRQLEEVIYYDSFIVTEVKPSMEGKLAVKQALSTVEYSELKEKYQDQFKAEMGASAIKKLLSAIDLKDLVAELRAGLEESRGQKRLKITKRLRVVEALFKSGNRPEWMVMDVIPVMPPDLRPMVQLEGGRFATSDLNDLYRRVVNRNNRLKRLMDIGAPEMIVRNEKRMLQEAVDVLISNGKRGRSVTGSNGRPLKSLGNIIEGKQGRFRQNLLGKRVDYSGRSVIVVGPHLKFNQCGLPKEMALELFKPFVIRKLVEDGIVTNVKSAKRKIERRDVIVWDILEEVINGHPVLLNRAPTLHRLGIQAFEPILVEGSAIQIHPLVCTAFNADFDGDQMAVHVPLSFEAQAECRLLILSTNNILSPSNGRAIVTPTQDMVLGCYFLTVEDYDAEKGKGKVFANREEAWRAWDSRAIGLQTQIVCRMGDARVTTTMGRIIFNSAISDVLEKYQKTYAFINESVGKKQLSDLVFRWYSEFGNDITSALIDNIKTLGFRYSTLSGISISIDDLRVPAKKPDILAHAELEIEKLEKLQASGSISGREKMLRSIDLWREATGKISDEMESAFGRLNNVTIMAHSGARGNMDQVRQLAGMRGLMSDSQGRILVIPIKSNFKEGLSLTEYFNACYGARKGLVDTALRTADSGYLTRRLVDVAQDVMITEEDCGTSNGLEMQAIKDGINIIVSLAEQIEGRIVWDDIDDAAGNRIVSKGDLISEGQARLIQESGADAVRVRHIYKCRAERGICQKCYGLDLASGRLINVGEAVGIIAAQSIGEPGTQLTMRTFHTGGVDLRKSSKLEIRAKYAGVVSLGDELNLTRIKDEQGEVIWVNGQEGNIILSVNGETRAYLIPMGSTVLVKPGMNVETGTILAEYDPSYEYTVSESSGKTKYISMNPHERRDEKDNVVEIFAQRDGEIFVYHETNAITVKIKKDLIQGYQVGDRIRSEGELPIGEHGEFKGIILSIGTTEFKVKKDTLVELVVCPGESYPILSGAKLFVEDGATVRHGEIIARERIGGSDASKTKDIVQGLPRVEELAEARRPKECAVVSEMKGVVDISERDGTRYLSVIGETSRVEYRIPYGVRLKVFSGKSVSKGDQLTDGVLNPHDILETKGVYATQSYLADEIQAVYRSQGVRINSKHIEVIVRQMTRKVNIVMMGDSSFLPNEMVDIRSFDKANYQLINDNKAPAIGERILLGITRASLNTESPISAASFQETARVLAEAAIKGKTDEMYGLKENVIIGKLIPAGTGLDEYHRVGLRSNEGSGD